MSKFDKQTQAAVLSKSDEYAVDAGYHFDLKKADAVRFFFRSFLRHSKGEWAGKPFELLDWQWNDLVRPLFGWIRPDSTRRYRRAYVEVPKKNGKSSLCAGISLYLLLGDQEPGSEVYNAAADRDQASIVFNEASNMVESSPALIKQLTVVRSTKRILYLTGHSIYRALSAEVGTKEGLNIHGLIFDELHAQKSRSLWDTLTYGGSARRQPLLIAITTAGFDRESICYEQHRRARGILDGSVRDPSFFALVRAASDTDDWTDPHVWRQANPSFGVTVKEDQFIADALAAQASPALQNAFRRYRLNQWVEQEIRWLDMRAWDACAVQLTALEDRECWAGLDLASTTDLASLVLLFPAIDGSYDVLPFYWVPESACERRERTNKVRIDEWVRTEQIEATPGDSIDYDRIRAHIVELGEKYNIQQIAIDRWNSTQLATQLQGDGFQVMAFGQGYASMTAPTKELEALILSGKIRHGGHPVLRWNAGNVTVEQDAAGNLKPNKEKSTEKVDGIVATIMALGIAMVRPMASVYDERGIDVL